MSERLRSEARQHCGELVEQGQQARGFEPDNRRAGLDMRGERVQCSLRFVARILKETGREKGSSATERAALRRVGADNTIAGARQKTLGCARVFRFEIAVEGIDDEDDRSSVASPHPPPPPRPPPPPPHPGGVGGWHSPPLAAGGPP